MVHSVEAVLGEHRAVVLAVRQDEEGQAGPDLLADLDAEDRLPDLRHGAVVLHLDVPVERFERRLNRLVFIKKNLVKKRIYDKSKI